MLVEVDAAAVAVLLLVRLIAEGREVVRRLPVRKGVEQPQKLAVNAPRCRHARRQERQRPIARIWLPVAANLVSSGLVKELVGPIRVAQFAVALHIARSSDEVVAHGDIDHQIILAHKVSTHNVEVCPAMAITGGKRLDTAGVAGNPENPHERAQHMLVSTIPVPTVVVAAVDVIAVMTIALASARFLGDRSQSRTNLLGLL